MKALILAAGYGKRLCPITDTIPKAMVSVNGIPLLENLLNCLIELGIKDIGIVVGHMAEYIRESVGDNWHGAKISYYFNNRYMETNNVFSLYQASDFCDDDMLLLECDIFCRKEMVKKLLSANGECAILVSAYNPLTMDGTVVEVVGDKVSALILGKWQQEGYDYTNKKKTVNMYRFAKEFLKKYMSMLKWYVEMMSENSYYEKVLGALIYYQECDVRVVEVSEDMWCEIDDLEDLERAKKQFS